MLCSLALTLALSGTARAGGGNYVFSGGTGAQQAQVRNALNASAFDWSLVPAQITIRIARGIGSEAVPGTVSLDADLLNAGRFSWGVVQHEYAHQVDFYLFDDAVRAALAPRLGGEAWWQTGATPLAHDRLTSERFASTLAWAYWQSPDNVMKPASKTDESAAMAPAAFRAALAAVLVRPELAATPPAVVTAAPVLVAKLPHSR
jgi:hypothetical protein